jgi:predicted nucleic acid-binding protein
MSPSGWGEIQAYAQMRGRPRPANDSWIAACCLVRELPLATSNVNRRHRGPGRQPV